MKVPAYKPKDKPNRLKWEQRNMNTITDRTYVVVFYLIILDQQKWFKMA